MNKPKMKICESELKELYLNQGLSSREIADKFGCGKTAILERLHILNIPLKKSKRKIAIDKNNLDDLYTQKRLSMVEVAKLFNTDASTILNRIREYNIPPRSKSEALKGRIPWNKGEKSSEETIKKLRKIFKKRWNSPGFRKKMKIRDRATSKRMKGDGNPMKDKNVSEKVRKKLIGLLVGDRNPMKKMSARNKIGKILKGHIVAQETREKISKNLMGRYGGDKNPFYGKHHTYEVREKSRKRAIRQLVSGEFKNRATSIEIKIEEELVRRNIFYKKQFPLAGITVADFYFPRNKIVVYADGDFWHKSDWARIQGTIEKDKKQNIILTKNGYKVFRFSETEINNSANKCVDKIVNYINSGNI